MTKHLTTDLDRIRGAVLAPGDPGWDVARTPWHLLTDQRPELIVEPVDARDVAHAVRHARAHGLRLAAQSTGHGASDALEGALLIRTGRLNRVVVDPLARTALVGAGARWSDVIAAATPHGLTGSHGFSAGVGVAGYVLGGGLGWLARRHGLASERVRAFTVVTVDGESRRVDAGSDPDLFWALRGGGAFVDEIVTAIELELVPLREAYAGALFWPIQRANEIVHAYREWLPTTPDDLTSALRLMRFPPFPQVPEPLRGRALVQLTLAHTGDAVEAAALVAPLRALGPELDKVGVVPAAALGTIAGDPVDPMPARDRSRLVASLTAETVDALVALAASAPALSIVEVRQLGGALRRPVRPGPIGAIDAEALLFASGVAMTAEDAVALETALSTLAALGPRADRDTLPTFAVPGDVVLPAASAARMRALVEGRTYAPTRVP